MKASIVAYDHNRTIGNHGDIPWQGKMKSDSRYFRDTTMGHPVIMGRGTYEAMGRLLPKRLNIIVTRGELAVEGAIVVHTLEEAYRAANGDDKVFVIGGGQIYQAAMDSIDMIYATEIDAHTDGDAHFPVVDPSVWREVKRQHYDPDEQNVYAYDFVVYERI
nr:Dihydrofolate reductase [uncultured bacterium]AIA15768.1 Dihydrofolate reductase [uncultured bacterium]